MEKELFSFARIVAKLPPKRNKHYKKDFAHIINDTGEADKLSNVTPILRNDIGLNTLVSDISVTINHTVGCCTRWSNYISALCETLRIAQRCGAFDCKKSLH